MFLTHHIIKVHKSDQYSIFTPFASFAWGILYKVEPELGKIAIMYVIFWEKS